MTAGQMNYFVDIVHIAYIAQITICNLRNIRNLLILRYVALRRLQEATWAYVCQYGYLTAHKYS